VTPILQSAENQAVQDILPDTRVRQTANQQSGGRIYGTVLDPAGAVVAGAQVTLETVDTKEERTQPTDNTGAFNFLGLGPGKYQVKITSNKFAEWVGPEIVLSPGEHHALPDISLHIAPANTSIVVHPPTQYELAEEQMHVEEKQRVLGVFPNFYTSYVWNAAPLTSGQKFRLAWRTTIDPVTILTVGAVAGVEQWQNYFSGYGQGAQGYAKRFGASYGNAFIGIMAGGYVFPSLLHQDPRYFYKGTGSVLSRALYAISTVVITKGDNGRWQPNYSNVLGNLAAAGASNLYYPSSDRHGAQLTIDNALIGTAAGAIASLFQEFVARKISSGVPPPVSAQH
jgi:hypothetical protein